MAILTFSGINQAVIHVHTIYISYVYQEFLWYDYLQKFCTLLYLNIGFINFLDHLRNFIHENNPDQNIHITKISKYILLQCS